MADIMICAVICTYNRADLLGGAIKSLCDQTLDPAHYEIIVVNNASTDNTAKVVAEAQSKYTSHRIVYIYEAQPGLGHARNTAYKSAAGRYIAYLDDDAKAEHNWLAYTMELVTRLEPAPVCVGGPILTFYSSQAPAWFKDNYEVFSWGDVPRKLIFHETFYGSNMIWDKTILEQFDGFGVNVGVKGDVLALGEETVLSYRVWDSMVDPHFFYSPELKVYHYVPDYKMRLKYQLIRQFARGQSLSKLTIMESKRPNVDRFVLFFGGSKGCIVEFIKTILNMRQHPYRENWIVENWGAVVRKCGQILGALGIYPTIRRG